MPAMRETWVQLLDREDPLEKETTTHSSILAWRVPWTEEPGGLQVVGSQESDTTWHYSFLSFSCTSCDHCAAGGFSPLPFKLLHLALHSTRWALDTQSGKRDDTEESMGWRGTEGCGGENACLRA